MICAPGRLVPKVNKTVTLSNKEFSCNQVLSCADLCFFVQLRNIKIVRSNLRVKLEVNGLQDKVLTYVN